MKRMLIAASFAIFASAFVVSLAGNGVRVSAAQAVAVDADDIGGVVTGASGPEAGVWVMAETTDLPTKFTRIVVTDDHGRYLVPDLPKANYNVGCADTAWSIRRRWQCARQSIN